MLGIGIITCNRVNALQICWHALQQHTTTPHRLVVADDGSDDGTQEFLIANGIPFITGKRRRTAGNSNRALYHLFVQHQCDPVLLLHDNCLPVMRSWETVWCEAALRWGHVAYAYDRAQVQSGAGTTADPYYSTVFAGKCTATSAAAFRQVGYQNPRLTGWAYEDAEWAQRFRKLLAPLRQATAALVPCLRHGVTLLSARSWGETLRPEMLQNLRIYQETLQSEAVYRAAWSSTEEMQSFLKEVTA